MELAGEVVMSGLSQIETSIHSSVQLPPALSTLPKSLGSGFRRKVHFTAEKGESGKGSNLTGAQGADAFVSVPPGTLIRIKDAEDSPPLAELFKHGPSTVLFPN